MVDYKVLPGSLNLFEILVNYVAGNIYLAIILWAVVIAITAVMGRLSMQTVIIILVTFVGVATVGLVGALAAIPLTIFAVWFMVSGILNFFNQAR